MLGVAQRPLAIVRVTLVVSACADCYLSLFCRSSSALASVGLAAMLRQLVERVNLNRVHRLYAAHGIKKDGTPDSAWGELEATCSSAEVIRSGRIG